MAAGPRSRVDLIDWESPAVWRIVSLLSLAWPLLAGCAASGGAAPAAGTLVVLNKSEASASLFDLASGAEAARLPVGDSPHEAATSPDGSLVVVTNYGHKTPGNSLSVIDVARAKLLRTVVLDPYQRPHGLQFLDGRRVIVTAEAQASVLIVDVVAGRIEQAIVTGQRVAHMVAVAPDGGRAFVANIGSGSVSVLDLPAATVVTHLPTGLGAEGVDVSPDGREVWVSNRGADRLSVIDVRSLQPLATLKAAGFPIRVRFDPTGARAFVTVPRDDALLVFDARGRALERRIAMPAAAVQTEGRLLGAMFGRSTVPIGVTADGAGRRVYVAQANADQVAEFDVRDGTLLRTLATGKEPDGLAWSPLRAGSAR
jgi:YVTN family beta-propeller protein